VTIYDQYRLLNVGVIDVANSVTPLTVTEQEYKGQFIRLKEIPTIVTEASYTAAGVLEAYNIAEWRRSFSTVKLREVDDCPLDVLVGNIVTKEEVAELVRKLSSV